MSDRGGDSLLAGVIVAFGGLASAFWVGSHTAAFIAGGDLEATWAESPGALVRVITNPNDPDGGWQATAGTFGSTPLFWCVNAVFVVVTLVGLTGVWQWWTRQNVGIQRDKRLGMIPEARMATKKELAPIKVKGPVPGRFAFGRVMGHLVATEDPSTQTDRQIRNRAKTRVGDRTSVMVFGPTRSGKTATIVPGIIEWDLPAIISSVKDDVMKATLPRRLAIGDVYLFDPFKVARNIPPGVRRVSWSPISCSHTIDGARDAAQTLADAAASDDVTSGGFWSDRGATLLWPLLFAAALDNRSMSDVVRWLSNQDGIDDGTSEVRSILTASVARGGSTGLQSRSALAQFEGWARLDPRPRSDTNATAQSLVSCWNSLQAAASSDPRLTPIDIGRILSGRNTLYIVQPLGRGDQFAPLFGGLFGDLVRDQTYRVAHAAGQRIGPLLAVLDEAANTPLRWLPEVASTCAGVGVQLVTIWQDRSQIDALYGDHAQSLLNNHGTKIFFAGQTDPATLDYGSMLCGEEEVTSNSASADLNVGAMRRSASAQAVTKRLVPPDMLRLIDKGTAMLIHDTLRPFHMVGRRISEEPKLRNLAQPVQSALTQLPGVLPVPDRPPPSIEALTLSDDMRAAFDAARVTLDSDVIEHLAHGHQIADMRSGTGLGADASYLSPVVSGTARSGPWTEPGP